jgi:apoptosis-inducing factor 3
LDGLEKFEITEKNGELHIKVPKDKLNVKKIFPMSKKGNDSRRFVIIGGGPAAISAAETLRQSGFEGDITILAKENVFPYDRTMLSKNISGVEVSKI